ncbi:MAG: ATP-grasp domain-containing protein [Ignavibacteriae bacterium]|nr:ATP-grasp domain-containing protein [Ignavibacteriota bacterium]
MTKKLNIAVTGLNATDNPAPGIPVIRSVRHELKNIGKIIGLTYDAFDTGIYDGDLLDEVYLIPYPSEGEEALLRRIEYIHSRTPIDVFIPTLDSEITNVNRLSTELTSMGIKMFLPTEEQFRLRSKALLSDFCKKHSISCPRTITINDTRLLADAFKTLGTPIVVKGTFYEAYISYTVEEAVINFQRLKAKWGLPIIVQEYLAGEEYDVACVGSGTGKLIGAVPMRKLRLTEKGKAWAGVTIKDAVLTKLSEKLIKALKWRGPCELEFLKEQKSGKYYLVEINPRFPSWIYLSAGANVNLPATVVHLALGQKVKPLPPPQPGISFVRHATDLVCPISYLESLTTLGELIYH